MANLKEAANIYLGSAPVSAMYLGSTKVWEPTSLLPAPSYVQKTGADSNGSQFRSGTFSSPTVNGNTIVVIVGWDLSSNTEDDLYAHEVEISDNKGNVYERVTSVASTSSSSGSCFAHAIFVAKNIVGGSGHQINAGHSSLGLAPGFSAVEVNGASTTDPVATAASVKDTASPFESPSIAAGPENLVLLGIICGGAPQANKYAVTEGFTTINNYFSAAWFPTASSYLREPAGPTLQPTIVAIGGNNPAISIVALKP